MSSKKPIQDYYPDDLSHCYGCGRLNDHGHHIQSFWNDEMDAVIGDFFPEPYHIAIPGFTYGGYIASLIDCHTIGTAALYKYKEEGRDPGTEPALRYVTASLKVDYLKPTPLVKLHLCAKAIEIKGRKVVVEVDVYAGDEITVKGRVVAVQIPDTMKYAASQ